MCAHRALGRQLQGTLHSGQKRCGCQACSSTAHPRRVHRCWLLRWSLLMDGLLLCLLALPLACLLLMACLRLCLLARLLGICWQQARPLGLLRVQRLRGGPPLHGAAGLVIIR